MTILEAIQSAIDSLEGIRLPLCEGESIDRIRSALSMLHALKDAAAKTTNTEKEADPHDD